MGTTFLDRGVASTASTGNVEERPEQVRRTERRERATSKGGRRRRSSRGQGLVIGPRRRASWRRARPGCSRPTGPPSPPAVLPARGIYQDDPRRLTDAGADSAGDLRSPGSRVYRADRRSTAGAWSTAMAEVVGARRRRERRPAPQSRSRAASPRPCAGPAPGPRRCRAHHEHPARDGDEPADDLTTRTSSTYESDGARPTPCAADRPGLPLRRGHRRLARRAGRPRSSCRWCAMAADRPAQVVVAPAATGDARRPTGGHVAAVPSTTSPWPADLHRRRPRGLQRGCRGRVEPVATPASTGGATTGTAKAGPTPARLELNVDELTEPGPRSSPPPRVTVAPAPSRPSPAGRRRSPAWNLRLAPHRVRPGGGHRARPRHRRARRPTNGPTWSRTSCSSSWPAGCSSPC